MKVLVVGAGICGLTSAKICLDYGLDVTCLEKLDDLGGYWLKYKQQPPSDNDDHQHRPESDHSKIDHHEFCSDHIHIASENSPIFLSVSKEFVAFSDYPPPSHFPNFLTGPQMFEYLRGYAAESELHQVLKFRTEVNSVKKADDFSVTGKWIVKSTNLRTRESSEEIYDAVLMATGHRSTKPFVPSDPDNYSIAKMAASTFNGQSVHSDQLRTNNVNLHVGKRVLILDLDDFGLEVANQLSQTAEEVYLSTSDKARWATATVEPWGLPYDVVAGTRFFLRLSRLAPRVADMLLELVVKFSRKRSTEISATSATMTENMGTMGVVKIRPRIKAFTGNKALFEDGSIANNIDLLVISSGYHLSFPLLEPGLVEVDSENRPQNLYKNQFPIDLEDHHTLFLMGLLNQQDIVGAQARLGPLCELQARWTCEILLRRVALPDVDEMRHSTKQEYKKRQRGKMMVTQKVTNRLSDHHLVPHASSIEYMDQVSLTTWTMPNIWMYLFFDPRLYLYLIFGPTLSYQYRLTGSHVWMDAVDALVTIYDRVTATGRRRMTTTTSSDHHDGRIVTNRNIFLLISIVIFILFYNLF